MFDYRIPGIVDDSGTFWTGSDRPEGHPAFFYVVGTEEVKELFTGEFSFAPSLPDPINGDHYDYEIVVL